MCACSWWSILPKIFVSNPTKISVYNCKLQTFVDKFVPPTILKVERERERQRETCRDRDRDREIEIERVKYFVRAQPVSPFMDGDFNTVMGVVCTHRSDTIECCAR